jgi:hypothetical protein
MLDTGGRGGFNTVEFDEGGPILGDATMENRTDVFPPVSSGDQFRELYLSFLRRHSSAVIDDIGHLLQRTDVSTDVTDCEIQVFPDEYGDGHVSICMYFNGRNRLVRKNDNSLFCGACLRFADFVRDIPLYDPGSYGFQAVDIAVCCVIDWFSECWREAGGDGYKYPVVITGHEGFGTSETIQLSRGGSNV